MSTQVAPEGRFLEHTKAARMLASAVDALGVTNKWGAGKSARQLSAELGYRSSVALSHMATGRAPIPIDRSIEFARKLHMDPAEFLLATLEQRFPDIDFMRLLVRNKKNLATGSDADSLVLDDLREAAGTALSELPEPTLRGLREVLSDREPTRRILSSGELDLMDTVRKARPELLAEGLTTGQRKQVREFFATL